jgi:hypothetical protein
MSKMAELDHDLRAAKVLLVCVFHIHQPEKQRFHSATKAFDYYLWAMRTFPCHRVCITNEKGKVLAERLPALRY